MSLATLIAKVVGKECRVVHLEERKEVQVAFSDHSKATAVFGNRDETPQETGLRAMAKWVEKHLAETAVYFGGN
ncbi:MAG: hypothetical protein ABSA57_18885 [Candidatus Acidiferrales bacterium]|jgi:nucleoside-diphosphate-sugar epimerase